MTLTIIGFAAAVVALNAPPLRPSSRAAAEAFAATLSGYVDDVAMAGRGVRLSAYEDSLVFEAWRDSAWAPAGRAFDRAGKAGVVDFSLDDAALDNARALGAGTQVEDGDVVRVLIDPLGVGAGFTVRFRGRDETWRVSYAPDGAVAVVREAS